MATSSWLLAFLIGETWLDTTNGTNVSASIVEESRTANFVITSGRERIQGAEELMVGGASEFSPSRACYQNKDKNDPRIQIFPWSWDLVTGPQ